MAATEIIKREYAPVARVGKFYAAVYGSQELIPIGNVLEASTDQAESVEEQDDMTALGGGTHAELRRVTGVTFKAKLADLNIVNLSRALRGTVSPQDAGTVTDRPYTAKLGTLVALPHISVSALVVKKGATAGAAAVVAPANYELRPEGLWIPETAPGLLADDKLWLSYSYGDQVVIEALTSATPELHLMFSGLNEVNGGKASVIHMWRVSQGITKQLALINKGFTTLDIEGKLLKDPTKTGPGVSPYMQIIES